MKYYIFRKPYYNSEISYSEGMYKSTKLDDKEGCKLLKEFCDKVKLHDYYIF